MTTAEATLAVAVVLERLSELVTSTVARVWSWSVSLALDQATVNADHVCAQLDAELAQYEVQAAEQTGDFGSIVAALRPDDRATTLSRLRALRTELEQARSLPAR